MTAPEINASPVDRRSVEQLVRLFVHFLLCVLWLVSEALVFLACVPLFIVIELNTFAWRRFHEPNPCRQTSAARKEP